MTQLTLFSQQPSDDIQFLLLEKIFAHLRKKYELPREDLRQKYGDKLVFAHEITRCPRKNEFEKKFPQLAVAYRLRPAILLGELVHMGFSKLFEEAEPRCKPCGPYVVCGSADAMINGCPVELKYQRRIPSEPKAHHLDRIKIYMWLYGSQKGYLVYITPENIATYVITEKIGDAWIRTQIERKVYPRYDWECKICEYNGICEYARQRKKEEGEEE